MASIISIRLHDKILKETKARAQALHLSQTDYIRQAIEAMNKNLKEKELCSRIQSASLAVRNESMKINSEFSGIEHEPKL